MTRCFERVGTFEMSQPTMRISDPCYSRDCSVSNTVNDCLTGTWEASVAYEEESFFGRRVAALAACHSANGPRVEVFNSIGMSYGQVEDAPFWAGVDSGQCGFFDDAHYQDDSICTMAAKMNCGSPGNDYGEPWYTMCCHTTQASEQVGVIPYGVVSSSGFGDGAYEVFFHRERNGYIDAVAVVFIDEGCTEDEEDPDEFDEEDE